MISEGKRKVLELFTKGRNLYKEMKFEEAKRFFEEALEIDKKDGPSLEYIERCNEYIKTPPSPDWDGVYTMKTK